MREDLAAALAGAFLAGTWTTDGLVASGARVLGRRRAWLPAVSREVLEVYRTAPADRPRELAAVLLTRPSAHRAKRARAVSRVVTPTRMVSNPWHLPVLDDLGQLSSLVGLTVSQLDWFSDPKHWARTTTSAPLQHYRVSTRLSPSGAVRVLEAPKHRLRTVQRLLLDRVLDGVPAHDAAHGFRRGRSVATFAAPHAGQGVVLRMDLEGFFASVTVGRVYGTLRTAGYPEPVAHCLAGLVTTVLPHRSWRALARPASPALLEAHWRLGRRLASPHLPQGAPTSPALANLAAHRLDVRLTALAAAWGGRYTRYADDLALSGGRSWRTGTSRLVDRVADITRDEGFRVNDRKTAVMPRGGRQVLGSLVVNDRPRVRRSEVDVLRAVLHNCVRHGPSTQDREDRPDFRGHLTGRVGWVAQHDPARGARLRAELERIDWTR